MIGTVRIAQIKLTVIMPLIQKMNYIQV